MKMLLDVSIPHEPFNTYVREGTAGEKLGRILDDLKPEAIYFTERAGKRGCIAIVEVSEPSRVPSIAEPFFLTYGADVQLHIVMRPDDLQKAGLDSLGKKWA
jgi:hypothetical protein